MFYRLIDANRSHNNTHRLSDFFGRPESIDFIADNDNFDSLLRGLATQYQKRDDDHIDKEVAFSFLSLL